MTALAVRSRQKRECAILRNSRGARLGLAAEQRHRRARQRCFRLDPAIANRRERARYWEHVGDRGAAGPAGRGAGCPTRPSSGVIASTRPLPWKARPGVGPTPQPTADQPGSPGTQPVLLGAVLLAPESPARGHRVPQSRALATLASPGSATPTLGPAATRKDRGACEKDGQNQANCLCTGGKVTERHDGRELDLGRSAGGGARR